MGAGDDNSHKKSVRLYRKEPTMNHFTLIAHRGACLEEQEDTLASLQLASDLGADVVECDPRMSKDGVLYIFHDNDLDRLAGDPSCVADLTFPEIKEKLAKAGKTVTTFDELCANYTGKAAVLFDISVQNPDDALFKKLAACPFEVIVGVHAVEEAKIAKKYFDTAHILAFMAGPALAEAYADAGAGYIRLWENWLTETMIADVKAVLPPDRKVVIMMCDCTVKHALYCMNGKPEHLDRLVSLGADGALLNDIRMGVAWRK